MRAAIYCRKSDPQTGNADELSVARQEATARAFAAARGWEVNGHVYSDTASGAEFARRRGLGRLMAALRPRPPFDVLLVTDRDRLGREQVESAYLLKTLLQAGVRVFECQGEGREITLSSPTDKIIMAVQGYAAEVERAQATARTRAALEHRARAGRSVGGRIFGYEPAIDASGHRTRRIVPAEAAVVVRIFTLAAEGHGLRRIAATLNAEGALAPRKAGAWTPSTLRTVLANELYGGVARWGQTRARDAWGQYRPSRRDASEHVRVEVPALRIVDDGLWERAHARRDAGRALYFTRAGDRAIRGPLPASGSWSRFLLSGLGTCACCQGSMHVWSRAEHAPRWECMRRHLRGSAACDNGLRVHAEDADAAVLAAVEGQLLRVEVVETAMHKALALLAQDGQDTGSDGLRDELQRLDAECSRLADAVARGGNLESLLGMLQDREQRRAHVRAALAEHERQRARQRRTHDTDAGLAVMLEAIEQWQATLKAEVPAARAALQPLLRGRIVFTPGANGYIFEGPGTIAPVVGSVLARVSKGGGTGGRAAPPALAQSRGVGVGRPPGRRRAGGQLREHGDERVGLDRLGHDGVEAGGEDG